MKYNPLLHGAPGAWDVDRKPHKSDGGGSYYKNAEKLYGVQADTAQFMLDIGKGRLPGAVNDYADAAAEFSSPAFEARMVGQAGADAQQAIGQNTAAMSRNIARYGINPNSGRAMAAMSDNAMKGAAIQVGSMNNARRYLQDKKFGVAKDFYSSLVGMNSDAASQAGQAGGNFAQMGNSMSAKQQNEDAAWGNAIGMGSAMMFKDGGEVRMARGGLFGAAEAMPPPPTSAPQQGASPVGMLKAGKGLKDAASGAASNKFLGSVSKGLANVADLTGSSAIGETALGAAGAGTEQAGMLAAQNVGLEGATAATVDALGAGTAAAGEAVAAASPMLSGVAAAVPWVAAGAAIGSVLGLFADGGEVRKDMTKGGNVAGKGTGTSDSIPARLSNGEFVVNAESVKMPGVKRALENINAAGLAKRYGVM